MFERVHHVRIATILQSLDAEALSTRHCLFGGGTAISLSHREYRESIDIDFVVSDVSGYRELRGELIGARGINAITRAGMQLTPVRDIRADQYGIRTMLSVAGAEIKFEIVHEGRIQLDPPGPEDRVCGVATLTRLDMAATKLLANSDRWADDSVFSRDLIDLAMLEPSRSHLAQAIAKATGAYGESIERDLDRAIQRLREQPGRLHECMTALKMDQTPKALLWKRILALRRPKKGR